jgi:glutamate/tyrosine decarboxylase-like PLP-dependent enzyme
MKSLGQIESDFDQLQIDIAAGPILPRVTADEIRAYLSAYDFKHGMPIATVAADVEKMLRSWQVQVTHPRYFGLFNPSVTIASVVADALVAMYNSQLANWRTSPAGNEMERHTLQWLAGKFGLPAESTAMFTSGGTEANLTAVIVALTRAFPSYGEHGMRKLDAQPTIYLTEETHHSFSKITHMTGLGRRSLRLIPTDTCLKMNLAELKKRVLEDREQGFAPFMVVGNAGTTAAGVIDPLPELGKLCREQGLWFHVDAAWGGSAILSPKLKPYLEGIEAADSITCDAHKFLSVSMGCGMFFCAHPETVSEAFRADVSYMPPKPTGQAADPYTTSAQWSRRFIGLKLFMALAQQGEAGYIEMIEHQTRMGEVLREALAASGWTIVNRTPLPLVCFNRPGVDPGKFLAALHEQQIAWMSEARPGGTHVVRACVTSYRTSEKDIHWVVDQMNRLVEQDKEKI